MNHMELIVLGILSEAITGEIFEYTGNIEWNSILYELDQQDLLPLGYTVLYNHGWVDSAMKAKWGQKLYDQLSGYYFMLEEQDRLVQLLWKNGYPLAIMKGMANAAYYPKPDMRSIGDIDFLILVEDCDRICSLLLENGYKLNGDRNEKKHHINLEKGGIEYEMHRRPAGTKRHYSKANQELIQYFQEGLSETEIVEMEGYQFPVLDTARNGLMLLLHVAGHMESGIGVRHLLDWVIYADKFVDDAFWANRFRDICVANKVDRLAAAMTRIGQLYLGTGKEVKWCISDNDQYCEELLEYMLSQGNFGKKAGKNDSGTKLLTDSIGKGGFFRRLDRSSQYSLPITVKYPILRPVGWAYQILRYIHKGLGRDKPLKSLQSDLESSRRRRKLFENLGIQDWQDI